MINHGWIPSYAKLYEFETSLEKEAQKSGRVSDWFTFRKCTEKVNMKKHAIANYYDNIESYLRDANRNNQKLY